MTTVPPPVLVADLEAWDRMRIGEGLAASGIPAAVGSAFQMGEQELADQVGGVKVLVVALAPVTGRVLARADRLRLIAKAGIGTDNIDLEEARRRGIRVTRTPGVNLDGVAEYTIGAMIALARQFLPMDSGVRAGRWASLRRERAGLQADLAGETLGIIGLGGIGSRLAQLAVCLGIRVIANDPWLMAAGQKQEIPLVQLDTLLSQARFVSVNTVLTADTYHLIGAPELRRMRPDAYVINTARGPIVDSRALAQALEEGWIAGAAIDVQEQEPPDPMAPILQARNCLLTPHLAGASAGGYRKIGRLVVEQVARFLAGEDLPAAQVVI